MNSPRTTFFAICSAVGLTLWDMNAVPAWANVVGKLLVVIGNAGMGITAADNRKLKEQSKDIEALKEGTKIIN